VSLSEAAASGPWHQSQNIMRPRSGFVIACEFSFVHPDECGKGAERRTLEYRNPFRPKSLFTKAGVSPRLFRCGNKKRGASIKVASFWAVGEVVYRRTRHAAELGKRANSTPA